MGAILGSIALTSLVSYWVLAGAGRVRRVLGETGIRVLVRVMGLLAGGAGHAVFRQWTDGSGADCTAIGVGTGVKALALVCAKYPTSHFKLTGLTLPRRKGSRRPLGGLRNQFRAGRTTFLRLSSQKWRWRRTYGRIPRIAGDEAASSCSIFSKDLS